MRVTVAICTYNRAALLRETLRQMRSVLLPSGVDWEILVVNNNCTDDTDCVVRSFEDELPLRLLHEPTPGQSAARNRAVGAASGDYIIWTDDDVLVDPNWVTAYARAFAEWPDVVLFGGPVEPWFEGSPPEWLRQIFDRVRPAFATVDLGPDTEWLAPPDRLPYGANMALRMAEQREFLFDTALGLKPNGQMRGEETSLFWRLLRGSTRGRWVPDARVRHFIPRERQSWRFLRRFYAGYGQYSALIDSDPHWAHLLGRPRWLWRSIVVSGLRHGARRIALASPSQRIDSFKELYTSWGFITHYSRPRRHTARAACDEGDARHS